MINDSTMKAIDLKNIIAENWLDEDELAKELFPKNKFPRLALARVLNGDAVLDANQISKLSQLTGIEIGSLFEGGKWCMEFRDNVHVFTNGFYRAELDARTWVTNLYHKQTIFHAVVLHQKTILLADYLAHLDALISDYSIHFKQ